MSNMRVADFFCGAGGFSEGFRQAGFEIVLAVDKWAYAVNTHHGNHPNSETIKDDVERISLLPDQEFHELVPDTEIIIGSPPCVAFSNSNKSGKGDKSLGIRLLESYLRIVARKKFKQNSSLAYWILENVPNIQKYIKPSYTASELGIDGDFVLHVIHDNSGVYNSKYFGVPQNRKRFLCGEFPDPEKTIINEQSVLPIKNIFSALGDPKENLETIIKDPNYNFQMASNQVTDHHYIKELTEHEWEKAKRLKQDKGYMGRMAFPEDINKPARTVMANSNVSARESIIYGYKQNRYRIPTVRELASIMSFPIDYRFYGESKGVKSKLVGNAVPPKMAFAFAKSIAENLGEEVQGEYRPHIHSTAITFVNLNNTEFPMHVEKPKRDTARFKHHIPYLIVKAFRVELTNYNSDFEKKQFIWEVEIHKSQGERARVYKPDIALIMFHDMFVKKINKFINELEPRLVSYNRFQTHLCLTSQDRLGLLGPDELLDTVNRHVLELCGEDKKPIELINIQDDPQIVPLKIAVGYYVLSKIITRMRGLT